MDKQEILTRIESSLNNIRPFLQKDGGDVEIVDFNDQNEVILKFLGNCSTCSMSSMTFKNGIEKNIINDVPEVEAVQVINLSTELA
jgi:Fe-S cluster biogenesis protein NfuA